MIVYQRINGADWRNIWVVGDLHGCHTLLMKKLDDVGFDTRQDLLLSVGDLTDRGKENVECLTLITQPWFRAVRGNHELMMLDCLLYRENAQLWRMSGGDWFFQLDDEGKRRTIALQPKVNALPLVIEVTTSNKKYVICHADYPADTYAFGKPIDNDAVIWSLERLTASRRGNISVIDGADRFIFGHTPLQAPLQFANQHYIDTGAVFGGSLTLLQIQRGTPR